MWQRRVMANASTGYVVASGRWAHTTIPTDARSSSPIVNAYGYLRSPWNQNPAPFLSRSRTIFGVENTATFPDCSLFYNAFNYSTIGEFFAEANGNLHGPMHILTGGTWSEDPEVQSAVDEYMTKDARTFAADKAKMPDLLLMSKYLWRQGFLECPAACSADAGEAAVASCACACPLRSEVDDRAFWNASGLDAVAGFLFLGDLQAPPGLRPRRRPRRQGAVEGLLLLERAA